MQSVRGSALGTWIGRWTGWLAIAALAGTLAGCGESTPPAANGGEALKLDTDARRLSYTVGYQLGEQLRREGLPLDGAVLALGVQDAVTGAPPRLSAGDREGALRQFDASQSQAGLAEAERNRSEGSAFLAANRNNPDVVELPGGLQYRVIKAGKGPVPQPTDQVRVHYAGTLIDGTEFDSSYRRGEPAVLGVGQVIDGWQQALVRMPVGSRWQIFVPAELGYGHAGAGGVIGPDETLIFDVELLAIE
jgi:FKBP-type peptidyl-prolyl cis-trans isomerase FklB